MDDLSLGDRSLDERRKTSASSLFFENLVQGRDCGECVACCRILEIDQPELRKAADVLCHHNNGKGCGIYDTRPAVCRTWYCMWRRIEEMPNFTRPDRLGIVFSIDRHNPPRTPFERLYIVARAISDENAFNTETGRAALNMFIDQGALPVFISFDGVKRMIFPDKMFGDAILNPQTTPYQSLVPAALTWRKNYGLD